MSHGTVYPLRRASTFLPKPLSLPKRPGRDRAHDVGTIPYRLDAVTQWVRRQPDAKTLLVCYEAGPTGFGLVRHLRGLQVASEVITPGLIPHRAADRVKTDRRDARTLAEDLRAGSICPQRRKKPFATWCAPGSRRWRTIAVGCAIA